MFRKWYLVGCKKTIRWDCFVAEIRTKGKKQLECYQPAFHKKTILVQAPMLRSTLGRGISLELVCFSCSR